MLAGAAAAGSLLLLVAGMVTVSAATGAVTVSTIATKCLCMRRRWHRRALSAAEACKVGTVGHEEGPMVESGGLIDWSAAG